MVSQNMGCTVQCWGERTSDHQEFKRNGKSINMRVNMNTERVSRDSIIHVPVGQQFLNTSISARRSTAAELYTSRARKIDMLLWSLWKRVSPKQVNINVSQRFIMGRSTFVIRLLTKNSSLPRICVRYFGVWTILQSYVAFMIYSVGDQARSPSFSALEVR